MLASDFFLTCVSFRTVSSEVFWFLKPPKSSRVPILLDTYPWGVRPTDTILQTACLGLFPQGVASFDFFILQCGSPHMDQNATYHLGLYSMSSSIFGQFVFEIVPRVSSAPSESTPLLLTFWVGSLITEQVFLFLRCQPNLKPGLPKS